MPRSGEGRRESGNRRGCLAPFSRGKVMDLLRDKLKRYSAFWAGAQVERPLIGFSLGGWFPLHGYLAMEKFRGSELTVERFHPEDLLPDYDRLVAQWDEVKDDLIRAVAPLPPFPWLEAAFGRRVQVGDGAIWAEEGGWDYSELDRLDLSKENRWRKKYLEFTAVLKDHFEDRHPIGQPILRGPADMIVALRGASQMVLDLYDRPEEFQKLAGICSQFFIDLILDQQKITGPFHGGYLVEHWSLWAPGRVARLQEDATALFSPDLYVKRLRDEDERLAKAFPYSGMHLHATSLFLVDWMLEIDSLACIQINKDQGSWEIEEMLPYFKKVQNLGKKLMIRGKFLDHDIQLLRENLSPAGLYLQIVIEDSAEARLFDGCFRPWV